MESLLRNVCAAQTGLRISRDLTAASSSPNDHLEHECNHNEICTKPRAAVDNESVITPPPPKRITYNILHYSPVDDLGLLSRPRMNNKYYL